ncbi:Pentatricopeptide repeat-containing protein, chloroplastic [Symbiodinium microadriaticum]|uniref:Pentatricopeptide repeat-containing protein, chloroplastic n=1 Tax=Symbiodinium microadriaticum TaxID=2951 RepID=A0A1Q9CAS1_SYMMI|nr:Pentatricopeptide repeat-containing protein, chloroplastic [Symbiodinium microadriaticum]
MALYLLSQMPAARVVPDEVVPDQISVSAGISACEKGGEWQMALLLLSQMPLAGVVPNEFSFNAGISACEKGGEWKMAPYLLSQMPAVGVVPDEISFGAGIKSCGTARIWEMALSLLASIRGNQLQPAAALYGQAIGATWPETVSFGLFDQAILDQTWPNMLLESGTWIDLHDHSCCSAVLAVSWWLAEVVRQQLGKIPTEESILFEVITGWGKSRMPWQPAGSDLQVSVRRFLDEGIDAGRLRALYPSSPAAPRQ